MTLRDIAAIFAVLVMVSLVDICVVIWREHRKRDKDTKKRGVNYHL